MSLVAALKAGNYDDVKRLIDTKANPNEKDKFNQTPLHIASLNGSKEVVSYLLQKYKKIDVNAQDDQLYTPLMCAIINCHFEVCECLLSVKSVKTSIANRDLNTPLIALCKKRSRSDVEQQSKYSTILATIISRGLDVNDRNKFGETALHYAAMSNNHEAIDLLYENNANINSINKYVLLMNTKIYTKFGKLKVEEKHLYIMHYFQEKKQL